MFVNIISTLSIELAKHKVVYSYLLVMVMKYALSWIKFDCSLQKIIEFSLIPNSLIGSDFAIFQSYFWREIFFHPYAFQKIFQSILVALLAYGIETVNESRVTSLHIILHNLTKIHHANSRYLCLRCLKYHRCKRQFPRRWSFDILFQLSHSCRHMRRFAKGLPEYNTQTSSIVLGGNFYSKQVISAPVPEKMFFPFSDTNFFIVFLLKGEKRIARQISRD